MSTQTRRKNTFLIDQRWSKKIIVAGKDCYIENGDHAANSFAKGKFLCYVNPRTEWDACMSDQQQSEEVHVDNMGRSDIMVNWYPNHDVRHTPNYLLYT